MFKQSSSIRGCIEKHWFQGVVGLYFLCSKNIGADQLRSLLLQNCKFASTRFYLTRVLFLSAPFIMQKV